MSSGAALFGAAAVQALTPTDVDVESAAGPNTEVDYDTTATVRIQGAVAVLTHKATDTALPSVVYCERGKIEFDLPRLTSVSKNGEALDVLARLPTEHTVAGKLAILATAFEALVTATRERCAEGLSADDLVPLLTLTLVTARIDVAFEGFVLDELLCDVVASGREAYCSCTLAVALGFLRTVDLTTAAP